MTCAADKEAKPVRILDLRGTYKGGGGPDKTILLSARMHDKERVFVLVTYLRDPGDHEFEIADRAKALNIDYAEAPDRKLLDFQCLYKLNALLKLHRIDILHAHDDKGLLYGWILKLLNPGLKFVYTCHLLLAYSSSDFQSLGEYLNFSIRSRISLFLTKRALRPIMAVSGATRRQLVEMGVEAESVSVLHNGIDTAYWTRANGQGKLREELGLGSDGLLVGTVARIDYQKDFPTFLKVASVVKSQIPNCEFVIVGDGKNDELSSIKRMAEQECLGGFVHFTGHRNDLLEVYSSFDVFLMTSVAEGLPNTVLEAMAMEVPVVSTSVAGVPELVVDGGTGFLCNVGDVEGISRRVVELLSNKDLRSRYSQQSRKRIVEHFSFSERVRKLEEFYLSYAHGGQ